MRRYHDEEWGVPSHDDTHLFEMLILEGAKRACPGRPSSTSGTTTGVPSAASSRVGRRLRRGEDRRSVGRPRHRAQPAQGAGRGEERQAYLAVGQEEGSFDVYLWNWVDGNRVVNRPRKMSNLPARTELSDRMAKDLKRRGFTLWARPSSTPSSSRWAWSTTTWSPAPASDRPARRWRWIDGVARSCWVPPTTVCWARCTGVAESMPCRCASPFRGCWSPFPSTWSSPRLHRCSRGGATSTTILVPCCSAITGSGRLVTTVVGPGLDDPDRRRAGEPGGARPCSPASTRSTGANRSPTCWCSGSPSCRAGRAKPPGATEPNPRESAGPAPSARTGAGGQCLP